jgi:hypothetical protein
MINMSGDVKDLGFSIKKIAWKEWCALLEENQLGEGDILNMITGLGREIYALEGVESTPENPAMYIRTVDKTKWADALYRTEIVRIDPRSATREEIFALVTYLYDEEECFFATATFSAVEAMYDLDDARPAYGEKDINGDCAGLSRLNYVETFKKVAGSLKNFLRTTVDKDVQKLHDILMDMVSRLEEHASVHPAAVDI